MLILKRSPCSKCSSKLKSCSNSSKYLTIRANWLQAQARFLPPVLREEVVVVSRALQRVFNSRPCFRTNHQRKLSRCLKIRLFLRPLVMKLLLKFKAHLEDQKEDPHNEVAF